LGRRRWTVPFHEVIGARPLHMEHSGERCPIANTRAVVDAFGRHRLAARGAHLGA
jgi:hypothetical protein